ncbi:hypothetical protein CCMSSC00406_0008210 [Pleurotus cornucopiae]|uniref:Uncharacterized protein n=1 Tax=Pleurotus cornucopiae TaxID=5321 RepID=A0ACB7IPX6_PLECO|nr:hypothetical protein CCMSSC00406_0008210 [Pleurotus cornucopiae]
MSSSRNSRSKPRTVLPLNVGMPLNPNETDETLPGSLKRKVAEPSCTIAPGPKPTRSIKKPKLDKLEFNDMASNIVDNLPLEDVQLDKALSPVTPLPEDDPPKPSGSSSATAESAELEGPADYLAAIAMCPGYQSLADEDAHAVADEDDDEDEGSSTTYNDSILFPPSECQVFDESDQAASLRPIYKHLPNLEVRAFSSWKDIYKPVGRMNFDTWNEWCPNMNKRFAFCAITFVAFQRVVHLARCDPRSFAARHNPRTSSHGQIMTMSFSDAAVISLVPIRVTSSCLTEPGPRGKKSISGVMHTQDMDRFIAVICMVFGQDSMHCNFYDDIFTFETRAATASNTSLNGSPYKQSRSTVASLQSRTSTSHQSQSVLSSGSGITAGYIKSSLAPTDEVRVYDGRTKSLNWASDMGKIHEILPQFNGEVPDGSFAVVAHTVTTYDKKIEGAVVGTAVSFNVQWVLLLGSPDQKKKKRHTKGTSAVRA